MIYTVVRIEEDTEYGCEERLPGSPVMAVLTLKDEEGKKRVIRYPDRELYNLDINEGDSIFYEPGKSLEKVLDESSGSDREYGQTEIRGMKDVLGLIEAFAVVALIIGILITAFSEDYTTADDVGKSMVIVSFIIAAICQIIIWIKERKKRKKGKKRR